MKEPLLISACFVGENCKYSGGNNYTPVVEQLKDRYELIPVCPERDGGLSTPRECSERTGDRVISKSGVDVTEQFVRGAEIALKAAVRCGCKKALLKERSPSCGSGGIYDGTFTGTLVSGDGIAAQLLRKNGITIYGESSINELMR